MIKKILVAIDGSKPAEKALDFALDMADKYTAKILLLSVVHHVIMPYGMHAAEMLEECKQALIKSHKELLNESIKKAKKIKPQIEISTELIEGDPGNTIVRIAEDEKFDIIIMGSRGLSRLKRLILGSVSNSVVNHANVPVLIIR